MRYIVRIGACFLLLGLCACGSSAAPPTVTPAPPTPVPSPRTSATAIVVAPAFAAAVHTLCRSLRRNDSGGVIGLLANYQYNTGIHFGQFGDGIGRQVSANVMRTWLNHRSVRCTHSSTGVDGHGTVLTAGWKQPGGWALIELDTFGGKWKVNDFTFGDRNTLYRAMQTDRPIVSFRAV